LVKIDCPLTAAQASAVLGGQSVNVPDSTPVCLVTLGGSFTFGVAPPHGEAATPPTYSDGFEVFDATTGNLLMDGGLATP
jgi:hypothetical protein